MKVGYFSQTDTLYIEFRDAPASETRDLDENTLLDVDAEGNICAITVEHAAGQGYHSSPMNRFQPEQTVEHGLSAPRTCEDGRSIG